MRVRPSVSAKAAELVDIAQAGQSDVQVLSAAVGDVAVAGMPVSLIAELMRSALTGPLNQSLHDQIVRAIALAKLPPATTLTLRNFTIDPGGITFQPALGCVGTGLSTYQPTVIPLP